MQFKTRKLATAITAFGAAIGIALTSAPANAATVNSWIGPWTADGINYLHYSTISNTPLWASSRIYTVNGNEVPPGYLGVRARLFKSGALCEATVYRYNTTQTPSFNTATTQACGNGSYNSHGFVAAWVGADGGYSEVFTFPTNPLNYTAPAARSVPSEVKVESGVNSRGQTYGRGDTRAESPDLVAAIATNGRVGYIKSEALNEKKPSSPAEAVRQSQSGNAPTVPVYDKDGTSVIGQFTFQ